MSDYKTCKRCIPGAWSCPEHKHLPPPPKGGYITHPFWKKGSC